MDPDAKVQVATLGTKLEVQVDNAWVRIYGLASTPDFGGQPNTIDSTTLDNKVYETSVQGLQPAVELSYEINMMSLTATHKDGSGNTLQPNLKIVKALADANSTDKWKLTKASGVTFEYDAKTKISYNADDQAAIEKFTIYHDLQGDITVTVP